MYVCIMSRKMLIEAKSESVKIIRTVLGLHGVIVDSKKVVLFEYE